MRNLEYGSCPEKRGEHGVLGVRVDAAARRSQVKGVPEERGAGGLLERRGGPAEEPPIIVGR